MTTVEHLVSQLGLIAIALTIWNAPISADNADPGQIAPNNSTAQSLRSNPATWGATSSIPIPARQRVVLEWGVNSPSVVRNVDPRLNARFYQTVSLEIK